MEVIKRIPNWKTLYPAFALCDELNKNGITGWFFPAHYESVHNQAWCSTERDSKNSYFGNSSRYIDKQETAPVYAYHKF